MKQKLTVVCVGNSNFYSKINHLAATFPAYQWFAWSHPIGSSFAKDLNVRQLRDLNELQDTYRILFVNMRQFQMTHFETFVKQWKRSFVTSDKYILTKFGNIPQDIEWLTVKPNYSVICVDTTNVKLDVFESVMSLWLNMMPEKCYVYTHPNTTDLKLYPIVAELPQEASVYILTKWDQWPSMLIIDSIQSWLKKKSRKQNKMIFRNKFTNVSAMCALPSLPDEFTKQYENMTIFCEHQLEDKQCVTYNAKLMDRFTSDSVKCAFCQVYFWDYECTQFKQDVKTIFRNKHVRFYDYEKTPFYFQKDLCVFFDESVVPNEFPIPYVVIQRKKPLTQAAKKTWSRWPTPYAMYAPEYVWLLINGTINDFELLEPPQQESNNLTPLFVYFDTFASNKLKKYWNCKKINANNFREPSESHKNTCMSAQMAQKLKQLFQKHKYVVAVDDWNDGEGSALLALILAAGSFPVFYTATKSQHIFNDWISWDCNNIPKLNKPEKRTKAIKNKKDVEIVYDILDSMELM